MDLGGAANSVDYVVIENGKTSDGKSYNVGSVLAWNANNADATGSFTLAQPADSFNVDVVLANQSANATTGWDGSTLSKAGSGTLTLSALNTYSGATQINAGTLKTGVANNLGNSSGVAIASGATLDLNALRKACRH